MAQKKLKLSAVKRDDSKLYGSKKQVDVNGYDFVVDTAFRPSKINELAMEFVNDVEYFATNNIDITKLDMVGYISLLIIKHFSDFDVPEDQNMKLQTIKLLVDGDFFAPMINAFDPNEVQKVSDKMQVVADALKEGLGKAKEEMEKEIKAQADKADSDANGGSYEI